MSDIKMMYYNRGRADTIRELRQFVIAGTRDVRTQEYVIKLPAEYVEQILAHPHDDNIALALELAAAGTPIDTKEKPKTIEEDN